LLLVIIIGSAACQEDRIDSENFSQLFLNVYIDNTGRSLINGYVDDIDRLAFLESSEYNYDNNSKQLYAVTSVLTSKSNNNWSLSFDAKGSYDEYHVIFYFPADTKLKQIECSSGLESLFYAANESIIADVQGYDIMSPVTKIEYRLPLTGITKPEVDNSYTYLIVILLLVLLAIVLFIILRVQHWFAKPVEDRGQYKHSGANNSLDSGQSILPIDTGNNAIEGKPSVPKAPEDSRNGKVSTELTDELAVVMTTLTDREKAVIGALLKYGGKMTQAEIKYETDISKSSLSGILTSLERRKIITKSESGRTNIIELSERFLAK